jgi:hypothetical protein
MNRLVPLLAFGITACASSSAATRVAAVPEPTPAENLISDRLYFGTEIPTGGFVSDSDWVAFSREVITPRFPAGFTTWRTNGQWLDPRGTIVREPGYVFEVFHERATPDSVFVAIANQYIQRFHQDAVLRATSDILVRLYNAPKPTGTTAEHK